MGVTVIGSILEKFYSVVYRLCSPIENLDIIRSYINYLGEFSQDGLPVLSTYCDKKVCVNNSYYAVSKFKIGNIVEKVVDEEDYDLTYSIEKFFGGVAPYTYNWSFTSEDVTLVSTLHDPILRFKVNPDKTIYNAVITVNLEILDSRYFKQTKTYTK